MKKIYIKTTEACQLHCKHCYIGRERDTRVFDPDKTIAWLKQEIGDEPALISFHGGEPFLAPLESMQKVCDAFPNAYFDATTNLMSEDIEPIVKFVKKNFRSPDTGRPTIKTSWDYKIRFSSLEEGMRWISNVRAMQLHGVDIEVIICLTKLLIDKVSPDGVLWLMNRYGIKSINFERLTANTTMNKSLIPDYGDVDRWLTRCYEENKQMTEPLRIEMFENMKWAAQGVYLDCRERCCMKQTRTINPNGTIGGCPNTAAFETFMDIDGTYDKEKHRELMKKEGTFHMQCLTCDLFKACHGDCHQLSWQGNVCPEPKTLLRKIIDDVAREKKTVVPDK